MAELKPFEVIMRLSPKVGYNPKEGICVAAEKVAELVRCKDCKHLTNDRIAPSWQRRCELYGVGKAEYGYCDEGKRDEVEE